MRKTPLLLIPLLLPSLAACGGSRKMPTNDEPDVEEGPIIVTVDTTVKLQTLEGFGASVAWYNNWFTKHPNRATLAQLLFKDLGFDILRLRNQHRTAGDLPDPDGLDIYRTAEASLGHPPRVLLTSWSPPPELKASGKTNCDSTDTNTTCSLRLDADGTFPYAAFADYWFTSLEAYHAVGLDPYYISIQNEPDFKPTGWEGCRFNDTERGDLPGYDRALDAVAQRFADGNVQVRMLGAETAQLQSGAALRYADAANTAQLYGIAHHLYDGSSWRNPNNFDASMSTLASTYPDLPKFQTEFSPTESGKAVDDGFGVAWLIHNSIAVEQASAYLHWELFWPGSGLISLSNPERPAQWTNADGYQILQSYYAFRHFARYTEPDDRVVSSASTSSKVVATAYHSPDESRLTVVMLNVTTEPQSFALDLSGFEFASSLAFVTTATAPWQVASPPTSSTTTELQLDAKAILTVVLSKSETPPP